MKLPARNRREALEVAMTPMIDVVFLLLVFFVWTSSFQAVEWMLPGRVSQEMGSRDADLEPPPPPPPEADFDELVIRVLGAENSVTYLLNDQPLQDLQELRSRLQAIAAIQDAAPVIIDPEPATSLGAAIDAYDAARLAGVSDVAFSAPAAGDNR